MKIRIETLSPGLEYAAQELKAFIERYTNACVGCCGDILLQLRVNEGMQAHCYSVHGDGKTQVFAGGSSSAVLCAVYEALAHAGVLFEANGYSLPGNFSMDALLTLNTDVQPKVRLRGIRQHINFPMDISSYPLKDAKEYIRALARMRFNAITFHSYPGQWHSVEPSNPAECPGHFFYGQYHPVPEKDELTASRINNRKTYCIPEVEAIFDDPAARGEYAVYWLNEVMKAAKEAYMTITLSVEPPFDEAEKLTGMLKDVCRLYPLIDTLEILSYESGADMKIPDLTPENAPAVFSGMLGDGILSADGTLEGLEDEVPHQLPGAVVCLKRMIAALSCRESWLPGDREIGLRAGMYITCEKSLRVLLPMMRKLLPADITFSMLPAHGAMVVADNIESLRLTDEDWQRFMLYSWAEFDGNMYLQQMSTDGLEKLTHMPAADSIYGLCINHWRTAENTMAIDFFAETSIRPTKADCFYRAYAEKTGIADEDGFAAACDRLAKLDSYTRWNLMNFGFCFVGCWYHPGEVTPPRNHYKNEHMQHARDEYQAIRDAFCALLASADREQGAAFLRLMANRCQTSVLHIDSLFALREINNFYDYDNPVQPDEAQLAGIRAAVDKSMALAQAYIHLYGENMPDRGCEGNIVSYTETMPVFIRIVASNFEEGGTGACAASFDAPPSPDTSVDSLDAPPSPDTSVDK